MKFSTLQFDLAARLATNTTLAALPVFLENDPALTPAQLEAQEAAFQAALTTGGLALVVLSPYYKMLDYAKDAGLSMLLIVPLAIVENAEVTRAVTDPAVRLAGADVQQLCLRTLLGAYKFTDEISAAPELGKNGLQYYYLLPGRRHAETAA